MPIRSVNIVSLLMGPGLGHDVGILRRELARAGFRVTVNNLPPDVAAKPVGFVRRGRSYAEKTLARRLLRRPLYHANIFIEWLSPAWFPLARKNLFLPNQEWFRRGQVGLLPQIDRVLCKTRDAERIFADLGARTAFVGFTSPDRRSDAAAGERVGFLHAAGTSKLKGTDAVLDLWLRHPKWPRLTVIQGSRTPRHVTAANIEHILRHVDDGVLSLLQNTAVAHLCPSEAEGFGHYIVEAMSCGAVVLTTDAPPMNELVGPDRGLLVPYRTARAHYAGTTYQVDPAALESAVERLLGMKEEERRRLGRNARIWYEENDRAFRKNFSEVLSDI